MFTFKSSTPSLGRQLGLQKRVFLTFAPHTFPGAISREGMVPGAASTGGLWNVPPSHLPLSVSAA